MRLDDKVAFVTGAALQSLSLLDRFLRPAQRASQRALAVSSSLTPAASGHQPSIVEALCHCILGDRAMPPASGWPPRSVAELMQQAPGAAAARSMIEQGLGALDDAVVEDTGLGFARLERPRQLAALFRLEAGGAALSKEQAEVFIDTFLTLAAQAYLHDRAFAQAPR